MKNLLVSVLLTVVLIHLTHRELAAQSLAGLHIGDSASTLVKFGAPGATDKYKSYVVRKWKLANDNDLSVTVDQEGKIVHLESDWGGRGEASGRGEVTESDLSNLRFGVTKLSDLRTRFGSNGFAFKKRGGVLPIADGVVMLNSYEIGSNVVTFFTVAGAFGGSAKGPSVAGRAKLDAISIADAHYAENEWGERIYDPSYRKVEWK